MFYDFRSVDLRPGDLLILRPYVLPIPFIPDDGLPPERLVRVVTVTPDTLTFSDFPLFASQNTPEHQHTVPRAANLAAANQYGIDFLHVLTVDELLREIADLSQNTRAHARSAQRHGWMEEDANYVAAWSERCERLARYWMQRGRTLAQEAQKVAA